MVSRRLLLGLGIGAGVVAAGGGFTAFSYGRALGNARAAIDPSRSQVIASRHGDLEFADVGDGAPLLMIHGTGGGFDQGLLFTRPLLEKGYRIIAPSRFGYLRSFFPSEPGNANQADAFVDLLDHLGIERVAVAGGSAGALSAIEFAIRHPDRCAALLPIVPATYVPGRAQIDTKPPNVDVAMRVLRSDFLFWMALSMVPDVMTGTLLATDPALLKTVSPEEARRAHDILWGILPVSARTDGLVNDALLAGAPEPMDLPSIKAPTYAISVEDDKFGTAAAARHIADSVPGAKLTIFESGGHIWLGHNEELFAGIDAFLQEVGYR